MIAIEAARDRLTARLNQIIGVLAERGDVLLRTSWTTDRSALAAWFDPDRALVTVNVPSAVRPGAALDRIDPLTPEGRRAVPALIGLCCHEAAHARASEALVGLGAAVPPAVLTAARVLEEPRAEGRQLAARPRDRIYLRAAVRELVVPNLDQLGSGATPWGLAQVAALVLGRRDAGVLDDADVAATGTALRAALGPDLLDRLRGLWQEAIALPDGAVDGLRDVAERWVRELPADADDPRLPSAACSRSGPPGPPVDGSGAGAGAADGTGGGAVAGALAEAVTDVVSAMGETVATTAEQEAADQLGSRHDTAPAAAAVRAEAGEREAAADAARRVFGGVGSVLGPSRAGVRGTRDPTAEERRLATSLGERLSRLQLPQRSRTTRAADLPPGRLSGRDAMLRGAQRSLGLAETARPFRQTVRARATSPELAVGIAVDVSGSMTRVVDTSAAAAWIVARAVRRVHGRSATVLFGSAVSVLAPPGEHPQRVARIAATDGTEEFAQALHALDGGLRLATTDGARLLVVVSDLHFRPQQVSEGSRIIARLSRAGVRCLAVHPGTRNAAVPGLASVGLGGRIDALPDLVAGAITREFARRLPDR